MKIYEAQFANVDQDREESRYLGDADLILNRKLRRQAVENTYRDLLRICLFEWIRYEASVPEERSRR